MQLKAPTFPLTFLLTGEHGGYSSLPKAKSWRNTYSSQQRCQIPVPLPSWRLGKYLAVEDGWLLRAPSASWFSLPVVDPTVLHKREKTKLFSEPQHLLLHHSTILQLWESQKIISLLPPLKGQPANGGWWSDRIYQQNLHPALRSKETEQRYLQHSTNSAGSPRPYHKCIQLCLN